MATVISKLGENGERRDITEIPGNPAHAIKANYSDLMRIADIAELREKALSMLEVGGISDKNARRFKNTVAQESSLVRLQGFLTNFMLKASGHGVIYG